MSMEELAHRLGVTTTTVQRWETEPQRLRVYQLRQLAEILNCAPTEIVDDTPPSPITAKILETLEDLPEDEQERMLAVILAMAGKPGSGQAA